jgi:hypothetical protein
VGARFLAQRGLARHCVPAKAIFRPDVRRGHQADVFLTALVNSFSALNSRKIASLEALQWRMMTQFESPFYQVLKITKYHVSGPTNCRSAVRDGR